jgi:hypothetical protein
LSVANTETDGSSPVLTTVWYGSNPKGGFYEVASHVCEWTPPPPTPKGDPFDAPGDADLAIFRETEHVDPFKFKAIIVDVQIRVENRTDKPKTLQGVAWTLQSDPDQDQNRWTDPEVSQELSRHERDHPRLPSRIGPTSR